MSNLKITQCKREGQVNRMSDDLISRKAVHEVFMNWYRVVKNDCDLEWNGAVDKLASLLMEQPPAFDKEKVIEELKQGAEDSRKIWHRFDDEHAIGEMSAYIRAIEIVDKGGIEQ